jgi:lipopolysaccharide export system protein LptA
MMVIRQISPRLLIAAALILPGAALHAQSAASAPPTAQPAAGAPASAPPAGGGPPNALQGFSQNRDQPVHIESATLEVHDKDKVAIFSGKVHVTQGDTVMTCKALHVFYEQSVDSPDSGGAGAGGDKSKPAPAPAPAPAAAPAAAGGQPSPTGQGQQSIKKMEAHGSVVVTQKDQVATGDMGIFEVKLNVVTLIGNVTMTQGQNVIRGDKLTVDLNTNVSRVENNGGRVQGLLFPANGGPAMPTPGAAPAPAQAPRPATAPAAAPPSN